jgi:hypothetical protein
MGFSMNSTRVFRYFTLLAACSGATSVLAQNPQNPAPRQQPIPSESKPPNQNQVKTFAGKIAKNNGKYVLVDLSSTYSYVLDDQKTASKYAGKVVLVTGVLDSSTNMIHVKKIDTAA